MSEFKKGNSKNNKENNCQNLGSKKNQKPDIKIGGHKKKKVDQVSRKIFIVKVCTAPKACTQKFSKYIWERICNEHGVTDYSQETIETKGVIYEKSFCLGNCKFAPNVKINVKNEKEEELMGYMNPLKMVKVMRSLQSGSFPKKPKQRD